MNAQPVVKSPEPVKVMQPPVATQPKPYFNLENKIPLNTAPLPPRFLRSEATIKIQVGSRNQEPPPKTAMPQQALRSSGTLGDIVRSVLEAPKLEKINLLEDHEERHIDFPPLQAPARTAPPPPNLPGMMDSFESVVPEEAAQPVQPKYTPPTIPVSSVKSYSADPYREPLDESSAA